MKKSLLTLAAFVGLVSMSQAAIIEWGLANRTIFEGTYQGGATAYLMFTEVGSDLALADYTQLDTRTTTVNPIALRGGLTAGAGATQTISYGDIIANTDSVAAETGLNGFFVRVWNLDMTHYIDSAVFTYTGTQAQLMNTTVSMNFGTVLETANSAMSHSSGGWTPVPEPATGALALAGAALLLRRRRRA